MKQIYKKCIHKYQFLLYTPVQIKNIINTNKDG